LDGTDMFLRHDWLVKHNPEVNWKNGIIKFTRCPGNCTMKHKDIRFKSQRTKVTEITETTDNKEQNNGEIGKKPDKTNPEDLPDYIQPFTHLFNKKKFKKLSERREWDHKINIMDEAPKELNAKAYTMTLKEKELVVRRTTQGRTHCGIKIKICSTMLLYSQERQIIMVGSRLQEVKPGHDQRQDTTISNWKSNR